MSVLDSNLLALCAIITIGQQLFFFFIASALEVDYFTDISGSMNFAVLALLTYLLRNDTNPSDNPRPFIITLFTLIWAFRLGIFLLYRVIVRGHDSRFNEIRGNKCSFLGFWIGQMVWVFIVSLPTIFANSAIIQRDIVAADVIGWIIWGIGFVSESVADWEKFVFNQKKYGTGKKKEKNDNNENKDNDKSMSNDNIPTSLPFLCTGIWKYSRHPNYFGEICCWLGLFLTSQSAYNDNTTAAYVSVLSPLFTFFLLLFASGTPLAERNYDDKYGKLEEYWKYLESTSTIIPMPNGLYKSIPMGVKRVLFCEFGFYRSDKKKEDGEMDGNHASGGVDQGASSKVGSSEVSVNVEKPASYQSEP